MVSLELEGITLPARETLAPELSRADAAFRPRICPRLAAAPEGLDVHRLDTPPLRFADLRALAVFEDLSTDPATVRLLLFTRASARPYVVAAATARLADFVETTSDPDRSLRAFLLKLARACPSLAFEEATWAFLSGRREKLRACPSLALATGLALALRARGRPDRADRELPASPRPVPLLPLDRAGELESTNRASLRPSAAAAVGLVAAGLPAHRRAAEADARAIQPSDAATSALDAPASLERRALAALATLSATAATALVVQMFVSTVAPSPDYKSAWLMVQRLSWQVVLGAAVTHGLLAPLLIGDGRSLGQALVGIAHDPVDAPRPAALVMLLRAAANALVLASGGLLAIVGLARADRRGLADLLAGTAQRAEPGAIGVDQRRRALGLALILGALLAGNAIARRIHPDPHDATLAQLRALRVEVRRFAAGNKGRPPTSFGQLPAKFEDTDVWGNRFGYVVDLRANQSFYEIRSAGRDQQLGTPDDLVLAGTPEGATVIDGEGR
jgi:hypothetical protein